MHGLIAEGTMIEGLLTCIPAIEGGLQLDANVASKPLPSFASIRHRAWHKQIFDASSEKFAAE
jgi:hypothetical protein